MKEESKLGDFETEEKIMWVHENMMMKTLIKPKFKNDIQKLPKQFIIMLWVLGDPTLSLIITLNVWHHIFTLNVKALDISVISLICCSTFTTAFNAEL